jgi:hypothetical protein
MEAAIQSTVGARKSKHSGGERASVYYPQ